jgi:hypothetical protein
MSYARTWRTVKARQHSDNVSVDVIKNSHLPSVEYCICPAWSTFFQTTTRKHTINRHENERPASLERVKKESSMHGASNLRFSFTLTCRYALDCIEIRKAFGDFVCKKSVA